jgi:hypothetical protein
MRAFHATSFKNVGSIKEKGIESRFDGVYLTDSEESALRWMGFRYKAMGEDLIAVIEVEVNDDELVEGVDHSPMMEKLFGVGRSLVSPKTITPDNIINFNVFQIQ